MTAVWKYPIPLGRSVTVDMPEGAAVVHVGLQGETPAIWALVDPEAEQSISRTFRAYGTGWDVESDFAAGYVGTCQAGPFVWHIFERDR